MSWFIVIAVWLLRNLLFINELEIDGSVVQHMYFGKLMMTIFWYVDCVILTDFQPKGETIKFHPWIGS